MQVRVATLPDVPAMVALGQEFIKEAPNYKNRPYVAENAAKHFTSLVKGGGVVYVSKDGQFLFEGRMIGESPEGPVDLTAPIERQGRAKTIDSISSEKFITYKAKGDLISYVTVFTDVGCPFCQKFHKEIDELTSAGIGVRYLPFPRSGVNGKDFAPLKSIWCAKNPKDAMDSAMKNRRIPEASCSSADTDIQT